MKLEQIVHLLKQIKLFESFDESQLQLIAFGSEVQNFTSGQIIFEIGQLGQEGYVVHYGRIQLVSSNQTEETLLAEIGPGQIFGDSALIKESQRTSRAIATEKTEVVMISRATMIKFLETYPEHAIVIRDLLLQRLNTISTSAKSVSLS